MKRCNCDSTFAHVIAYTSGTNRPCDIRGTAVAGIPIGVDVSKISESGISALLESTVPLLLDSGAFGEVSVCSGKIVATKPISDSEWHRRLQIYLIAPDHVGSQELTLRRL